MFFKNICVLVQWTKVASALEGLKVIRGPICQTVSYLYDRENYEKVYLNFFLSFCKKCWKKLFEVFRKRCWKKMNLFIHKLFRRELNESENYLRPETRNKRVDM